MGAAEAYHYYHYCFHAEAVVVQAFSGLARASAQQEVLTSICPDLPPTQRRRPAGNACAQNADLSFCLDPPRPNPGGVGIVPNGRRRPEEEEEEKEEKEEEEQEEEDVCCELAPMVNVRDREANIV